ncbi:hypothetical protein PBP221_58300 [Paraburkholderia sp. 22B1P]|nr:hypothetical protein PBP221_58300 [Paraburkholderia sp. 22B1P]
MSGWAAELIGDGPRCEFVDAVNRVVGDAREHVAQIGLRIDAVEFCGANEAVDGSGALTPGIGTGKQVIAPTDGKFAIILPISGRKLKSIIVGIPCMGVASRYATLRSEVAVAWYTSRPARAS